MSGAEPNVLISYTHTYAYTTRVVGVSLVGQEWY